MLGKRSTNVTPPQALLIDSLKTGTLTGARGKALPGCIPQTLSLQVPSPQDRNVHGLFHVTEAERVYV